VARIEERALRRTAEAWDKYTEYYTQVVDAAGLVAESLAEDLKSGLEHLEAAAKVKVLADVGKVAGQITSSLHEVMKAWRLFDDRPTKIVRHEHAEMSDSEVAEILLLAADAAKHLNVFPDTPDRAAWKVG
jgi:hypothetical protein